jgi:uncharacterized membrane protein HdeD (DUF308 family)
MKIWPILVGVWFLLYGLSALINLDFRYESTVMGVIALVAGVLAIVRK